MRGREGGKRTISLHHHNHPRASPLRELPSPAHGGVMESKALGSQQQQQRPRGTPTSQSSSTTFPMKQYSNNKNNYHTLCATWTYSKDPPRADSPGDKLWSLASNLRDSKANMRGRGENTQSRRLKKLSGSRGKRRSLYVFDRGATKGFHTYNLDRKPRRRSIVR